MLKYAFAALAITLSSVVALHVSPMAYAQTSFGKDRITTPSNEEEWNQVVKTQLMQSIRHAETALGMHGRIVGVSLEIQFFINHDGKIADTQLVESSGSAPLDQAVLRAASRTKQVAAFTPDMTTDGLTYTLSISTERR